MRTKWKRCDSRGDADALHRTTHLHNTVLKSISKLTRKHVQKHKGICAQSGSGAIVVDDADALEILNHRSLELVSTRKYRLRQCRKRNRERKKEEENG